MLYGAVLAVAAASILGTLVSILLVRQWHSPKNDAFKTNETFLGPAWNYVEVRASLIPGAGSGLFAKRQFAVGEVICEYRGKVLSFVQAIRLPKCKRDYLMGGFGLNVRSRRGHIKNLDT